jgi:hypothetical protein
VSNRKRKVKPLSRQLFFLGIRLSTRVLPLVLLILLILYAALNQAGISMPVSVDKIR